MVGRNLIIKSISAELDCAELGKKGVLSLAKKNLKSFQLLMGPDRAQFFRHIYFLPAIWMN